MAKKPNYTGRQVVASAGAGAGLSMLGASINPAARLAAAALPNDAAAVANFIGQSGIIGAAGALGAYGVYRGVKAIKNRNLGRQFD